MSPRKDGTVELDIHAPPPELLFNTCKECFGTYWMVVNEDSRQWLVCASCGTAFTNSSRWPELKEGVNKQEIFSGSLTKMVAKIAADPLATELLLKLAEDPA